MIEKEQDCYYASQPEFYVFLTKNLGKIFLLFFLAIFIVGIAYQKDFEYIKRIFHIVVIFSLIGLIIDRFLRRVAHKIAIDFTSRTLEFYMCRNGKVKRFNFDSLCSISNKAYTKFVLQDETVLYNGPKEENFNRSIDRIMKNSTFGVHREHD